MTEAQGLILSASPERGDLPLGARAHRPQHHPVAPVHIAQGEAPIRGDIELHEGALTERPGAAQVLARAGQPGPHVGDRALIAKGLEEHIGGHPRRGLVKGGPQLRKVAAHHLKLEAEQLSGGVGPKDRL